VQLRLIVGSGELFDQIFPRKSLIFFDGYHSFKQLASFVGNLLGENEREAINIE